MLLMAESQINSGSPPFLFPYCSAIFPPTAEKPFLEKDQALSGISYFPRMMLMISVTSIMFINPSPLTSPVMLVPVSPDELSGDESRLYIKCPLPSKVSNSKTLLL